MRARCRAQDLETIPLAARSFANIAYLVPGTEPVEPSDPTKARITAVSFGGSSGLNVQLSVDGADNSDDYIGGFLQNFSPDAIEEFAVSTSQENADTGRTTVGAVVITTKRGTDQWHGDAAFYDRAAALNARFPIDNPSPNPKQPFSRQNYIGTLGGPIQKSKVLVFLLARVRSRRRQHRLQPGEPGAIQRAGFAGGAGTDSRRQLDRGAQQCPRPLPRLPGLRRASTGRNRHARSGSFGRRPTVTSRTTIWCSRPRCPPRARPRTPTISIPCSAISSPSAPPGWDRSSWAPATCITPKSRNDNLGFALAFPFSSTSSTISGFETFGDNQFVTPITAFPVLRNQEKYQVRYDVSHATGRQAVASEWTLSMSR